MEYIHVRCAVCGSHKADVIYESVQPTGSVLGKVNVRLVMCRNCGFVYTSPRPNLQALLDYYTQSSFASGQTYHDIDPSSRHGRLTAERVSFIQSCLAEFPGGRLLDIGASFGDLLMALNSPGWDLFGLEPSQRAVELARAHGLDMIHSDIESIDIDGLGRFEAVCMISLLEHLYDPKLAMSRVAELLKSEGVLVLEVPDSTRPFPTVAEFYSFEHLSHFTLGSLSRLLAQFGFEVVSIDENVSVPNLRVAARKGESKGLHYSFPDDGKQLLEAIQWYEDKKKTLEQSLHARLSSRVRKWRREQKKVALYGAGIHTLFLLNLVDFDDCIVCLLDSDPAKIGTRFIDWEVYGPESIRQLGLNAIVISSRDYQEEIYRRIQHRAQEGIEIVRCYSKNQLLA